MNPDVKEKWLNLLRSEEYEQGNGQLGYDPPDGTPARRCCLGVLCEVAVREGVIEKTVIRGDVIYGVNLATGSSDDTAGSVPSENWESAKFYLPKAVREWAGLDHYSPTIPRPDDVDEGLATDHTAAQVNLATLNDTVRGYGFPEIADQVEQHL